MRKGLACCRVVLRSLFHQETYAPGSYLLATHRQESNFCGMLHIGNPSVPPKANFSAFPAVQHGDAAVTE